MSALDPAAFAALQRALTPGVLKDLGYDNIDAATKGALVSVAPSDCPAACNADVALGMCLCAPQSDGGCPANGAPAATDAAGLCKTLPANVTIFASEGGLGTTRVVSLIPSR